MKRMIFHGEDKVFERISKRKARKLYDDGAEVVFCPSNINPANRAWGLAMTQHKDLEGQYKDFDTLCNHYHYYNCNNETGKYISFYSVGNKDV